MVSLGAKIPTFERVDFYAYIEEKLAVDRVQVENSLTFATVIATLKREDWMLNVGELPETGLMVII